MVMLPAYKAGHPSKVDYNFDSCHSSPLTKRGMLSAPRQSRESYRVMRDLIKSGASILGLDLSSDQVDSFILYYDELKRWGSKINITALTDYRKIIDELFMDSLAPLVAIRGDINNHDRLLDIGSGGGFPGIPIKIAAPDLSVTLSDSIEKKVFFMRNVIRKLSLPGVEAIACRFEKGGSASIEKASFDWIISKAVTDIETMGRWSAPHLKEKGALICMKGPKEEAVILSGFSPPAEIRYKLPLSGLGRRLYLYRRL